jgi:hypothetical protein
VRAWARCVVASVRVGARVGVGAWAWARVGVVTTERGGARVWASLWITTLRGRQTLNQWLRVGDCSGVPQANGPRHRNG